MAEENKTLFGAIEDVAQSLNRLTGPMRDIVRTLGDIAQNTKQQLDHSQRLTDRICTQLQAIATALQQLSQDTKRPTDAEFQSVVNVLQEIAQNTRRTPPRK